MLNKLIKKLLIKEIGYDYENYGMDVIVDYGENNEDVCYFEGTFTIQNIEVAVSFKLTNDKLEIELGEDCYYDFNKENLWMALFFNK